MRKYTLLILIILAVSMLAAEDMQVIKPESDSTRFKRYTLQTIKVIGTLPSETIGAVSVKQLDAPAIIPPNNIKESLQNSPGITVTAGTKDESSLRIRGFRKNEAKILVDGRPLNAGYFGNVDLQNLPVSDIKEIYILKGPISSMYGSNTMGGVINLITREPSNKKWAKLGMQFKRNNTNHVELSTSHSFENWNYWLYGARDNVEGFILPEEFKPASAENGDVRNNLHKTQYNLQAKGSINLTELHTLGFTSGYTIIPKKQIPLSIYGFGEDYRTFKNWQRYQSTLMDDYILSEYTALKTLLWLDGGQDTYQTFKYSDIHIMRTNSTLKYWTMGLNPRLEWQLGEKAKLNSGYRGEIIFSTRKDNGSYKTWTPHYIGLNNLFSQIEYQYNAQTSLTGGLGLGMFKNDELAKVNTNLEPTFGAYYKFSNGTHLSLAIGMNTAYPTMQELFSADKGNPGLKPQYSTKYEVSVQRPVTFSRLNGSVETQIYYNNVKNLIDEFHGRYDNLNHVQTYGAEASVIIQPIKLCEISCSFSWLDYVKEDQYKLTESPHNSAEISAVFKLPAQISLAFTSVYKDYRLSQDDGFAYRVLPSYWTHGLVLKKSWKDLSFNLGLENLTDTYYEEEYGFPAAGINFNLGLQAEI